MAKIPAATPDGPKIRKLIWDSGYSIPRFAGMLRPRSSAEKIRKIVYANERTSIDLLRRIAVAVGLEDETSLIRHDDAESAPGTADASEFTIAEDDEPEPAEQGAAA
jgi:hypothetical protein